MNKDLFDIVAELDSVSNTLSLIADHFEVEDGERGGISIPSNRTIHESLWGLSRWIDRIRQSLADNEREPGDLNGPPVETRRKVQ